MLLERRLPLTRIAPGQYEASPTLGIVKTGRFTWTIIANGQPLALKGISEHGSLREAHGTLADCVDELRVRRALAGSRSIRS